jgi:hypothetical protein
VKTKPWKDSVKMTVDGVPDVEVKVCTKQDQKKARLGHLKPIEILELHVTKLKKIAKGEKVDPENELRRKWAAKAAAAAAGGNNSHKKKHHHHHHSNSGKKHKHNRQEEASS